MPRDFPVQQTGEPKGRTANLEKLVFPGSQLDFIKARARTRGCALHHQLNMKRLGPAPAGDGSHVEIVHSHAQPGSDHLPVSGSVIHPDLIPGGRIHLGNHHTHVPIAVQVKIRIGVGIHVSPLLAVPGLIDQIRLPGPVPDQLGVVDIPPARMRIPAMAAGMRRGRVPTGVGVGVVAPGSSCTLISQLSVEAASTGLALKAKTPTTATRIEPTTL